MRPPNVETLDMKVFTNAASDLLTKILPKPESKLENAHYAPLADILNACVKISSGIIKDHKVIPETATPWFRDLVFTRWDKFMADGIDGAYPLAPDVAGICAVLAEELALCWGEVSEILGCKVTRLALPCEVKDNDPELVYQAVTYAHALISVTIFRAFELVLGYNYAADQFRFLIFHRGGVSSSKGISLYKRSTPDLADLLTMFVSMMTWTSTDHAGFPLFTDGQEIKLPHPHDPGHCTTLTLQKVIYHALAIRSRNTCVVLASSATEGGPSTKSNLPTKSGLPTKSDPPTKRVPPSKRVPPMTRVLHSQRYIPTKSPIPEELKQSQLKCGSRVTTKSRLTRGNNGGGMKSGLAQGNNQGDSYKSTPTQDNKLGM